MVLLILLIITTSTPSGFIETYKPIAIEQQATYGVPWELALAQAALETGWGKSVKGNNYFGINATSSWCGESFSALDNGNKRTFTAHADACESFFHYGQLMSEKYRPSGCPYVLENWIDNLDGYAEDPKYKSKIRSIIRRIRKTRNSRA